MRIGIDVTAALRQGAGIGRFTRELVRALLALDTPHRYSLFAATGGLARATWQARLDYMLAPAGARRIRVDVCNLWFVSDDWLHRLWQRAGLPIPVECFTGRLDLFHEPDFVLPPTLPGTPTLLTVHDLTFVRDPDSAFPRLRRYLNRVVPRSVQRAGHVLADSVATQNDLVELFQVPPGKITVVLGGVEGRFAPVSDPAHLAAVRAKYTVGYGPFVLGLGTLQPRKNFKRLVQAFAHLLLMLDREERSHRVTSTDAALADLKLVIAGGKGWLYDDIFAEVQRLGLAARVIFPGYVDDEDLPALYSAASVFVYPSLYEGFGLPVLEAMACGAPVLTSNVSSLPEVAGQAALTVTPTDMEAIAMALHTALTDDAWRAGAIERGRAQAARFTWESAARQLLAVYEEALL